MMDSVLWDSLAAERYCAQPLDRFVAGMLMSALPASCGPAARGSFETVAKLLCASLNKGDTYLPLDEDEFIHAAGRWLDISKGWSGEVTVGRDGAERPDAGSVIPAQDIKEFLTRNRASFLANLNKKEYDAVVSGPEPPHRPLVYDAKGNRLYFERYFEAVRGINGALSARLGDFPFATGKMDAAALVADLLGTAPEKAMPDVRQTAALLLALRNKTLLVSGGPGTGKTTVVLQILRLFMRALPWLTAEDIRIAAPTGRAAARLQESIAAGLEAVLSGQKGMTAHGAGMQDRDESLKNLRGTTVHRLLGFDPSSATYARCRENPLAAAVAVVDEVSMLDIELFSRLLEALPDRCILILLGDRFQLPPVEAGAVLGDLTRFDPRRGDSLSEKTVIEAAAVIALCRKAPLTPEESQDLENAAGDGSAMLRDRAVILTRSHRSARQIQDLARRINNNDTPMALIGDPVDLGAEPWERILAGVPDSGRYVWAEPAPGKDVFPLLDGWLTHHFGHAYQELLSGELIDADGRPGTDAPLLLDAIERSRILTVVREGDCGAAGINAGCCRKLFRLFDRAGAPEMFHGLPIIITQNAPNVELYNGDCGVLLRDRRGGFSGLFRLGKECVVRRASDLPHWSPAFAMTVHKSQGSEYDHVLLVLPPAINPLCTREILYTAITRAKKLAAIVGKRQVLKHGLNREVRRNTGIEPAA